jgi:hypothetical protein
MNWPHFIPIVSALNKSKEWRADHHGRSKQTDTKESGLEDKNVNRKTKEIFGITF